MSDEEFNKICNYTKLELINYIGCLTKDMNMKNEIIKSLKWKLYSYDVSSEEDYN